MKVLVISIFNVTTPLLFKPFLGIQKHHDRSQKPSSIIFNMLSMVSLLVSVVFPPLYYSYVITYSRKCIGKYYVLQDFFMICMYDKAEQKLGSTECEEHTL